MKEFVDNNYMKIINVFILIVCLLIIFIFYTINRFGNISLQNLENFTNSLQSENLKAHGVILLTPDGSDKLVAFNSILEQKPPCASGNDIFKNADKNKAYQENTNTSINIPTDCTKPFVGLKFNGKQRDLVLIPGSFNELAKSSNIDSKKAGLKSSSVMFVIDKDPEVYTFTYPCYDSGGVC